MRQKSNSSPASSETLVRNIRRATRLVMAARSLDVDDVKLAVQQIEALAEHRKPARRR